MDEAASGGLSANLRSLGGIVAFVGASLTLVPVAISTYGSDNAGLEAARRNAPKVFALAVGFAALALVLGALYTIIRRTTRESRKNKADLLLVASVIFAVSGLALGAISTIPPKGRYPAVQLNWVPANGGAKVTITGGGLRPDAFGVLVEGLAELPASTKRSRLLGARIYPDQSGDIDWSSVVTPLDVDRFVIVTVRLDDDPPADCAQSDFTYTDEADGGLPTCVISSVPTPTRR